MTSSTPPAFERLAPVSDLRDIVQCYWRMRNDAAREFWIAPQAQPEVIFLDGEISLVGPNGIMRPLPRSFIGLAADRPLFFRAEGPFVAAGIRCHPCAVSLGTLGSGEMIVPQRLAPLGVGDPFEGARRARELRALAFAEITDHLETWLRRVLPHSGRTWPGSMADCRSVATLSETVGLHVRQLRREFRRRLNIEPRQYLRVLRFQQALRLLTTERLSLSDAAVCAGYADQSHFCRDVKRLTGLTPRHLLANLGPIATCFARLGAFS